MKTKRKTGKWLSLVLAFVLAIGALPVMPGGVTAKANVIREVAVTIDLPKAEERISACGTPTVTSDIYTVEVYKWLEGSYGTADDVSAAISDGTKVLTNTDTLEEKKSYTVLFQATTYGSAGNTFQGDGMSLSVNGENALFVKKISSSLEAQENIVIFAYSFTVPEIVEYNLKIGGIKVKSNNLVIDQKDTPTITSGSFVFDPSTYTLTMDNVVASGDLGDYFLQYSGEDDLTIQVVGTNTVTFTAAGWQGIRSDGKGNLRITSESNGELLIQGTALKMGIYFYNDLVLDGSLKLTCKISCYDSATGLKSDSGGTLTVEDDVNLFVYTEVDENATRPVSQGIYAKVVMNGGKVNIESYGAVSNSAFGIGAYTQINDGILTVACEKQAIYGSISFNYPGANPKIIASTNFDGSNPVTYNSSNNSSYKYIKVEQGDPKTAIDSLTLDTLYKPVAGEMPAYPAFSDGTDNIYYYWDWCVWDEATGTWSSSYDEEGEDSVGDSVFREGKKYALKLFVYPKSAYTFPSTMTIKHNEVNIPNYDELNPNVTYKKISSSGSSLELFITEDDMPVNTKTPVASAEVTINGYQYGKNAEDITVTLVAVGADFYKDEMALPSGWYLAIDADCDGEPEGFATGALKVDADYYLAVAVEAKEGYRVSSLTKEKITLGDGTASIGDIIMCNASEDMAELVFKLPTLVASYNISVTGGRATVAGATATNAKAGDVVTLMADAAPTGKDFDKWVIVSGTVTLADSGKATTSFTMPEGDVSVKATYKDAPVVPSPDDEGDKAGDKGDKTLTVGTSLTDESGKATYKVTTAAGTDGASVGQPAVEYVAPTDKNAKTVSIPSTITVGGVTYKVTAIADNAFKNNKNLTNVKIGSNVITIGKNAFYGCKNLQKVTIGNGVTTIGAGAFSGCSKLKTLAIGKNVTTIGDKAFYKCVALTKITIPAKVNKIGKQAFYGCKKLKSITIKTTKLTSKKVAKNAFGKNAKKVTVTLPKLKKNKKTAYAKMLMTKGLKKAKFK